jgi:transcriptional regulator with XRE-family HTH domain
MSNTNHPVGELIRQWRQRRRMSQLDLARDAEISTKHLSFLETGRAHPSRDMLLHLMERMIVPLRERNVMLRSGGFAPSYQERTMEDPEFRHARRNIDLMLEALDPNPALAVDRHWTMVAANKAVANLIAGVDQMLVTPPVNFIRLSLHPAGLAPRIINLMEWRRHIIERLRQRIEVTGDPELADLVDEVRSYPRPPGQTGRLKQVDHEILAVPLQLATVHGRLSFFNTTTVFGTPVDITLSELAIETFLPTDHATTSIMRRLAEPPPEDEAPQLARRVAVG